MRRAAGYAGRARTRWAVGCEALPALERTERAWPSGARQTKPHVFRGFPAGQPAQQTRMPTPTHTRMPQRPVSLLCVSLSLSLSSTQRTLLQLRDGGHICAAHSRMDRAAAPEATSAAGPGPATPATELTAAELAARLRSLCPAAEARVVADRPEEPKTGRGGQDTGPLQSQEEGTHTATKLTDLDAALLRRIASRVPLNIAVLGLKLACRFTRDVLRDFKSVRLDLCVPDWALEQHCAQLSLADRRKLLRDACRAGCVANVSQLATGHAGAHDAGAAGVTLTVDELIAAAGAGQLQVGRGQGM